MCNSQIARRIILGCAATLAFVSQAEARPKYNAEFWKIYKKEIGTQDSAKCSVCHVGETKKQWNSYGKAVGAALAKKDERIVANIQAAIKKAEAGKSAFEGKSFGDVIKLGVLPNQLP